MSPLGFGTIHDDKIDEPYKKRLKHLIGNYTSLPALKIILFQRNMVQATFCRMSLSDVAKSNQGSFT